VGGSMGAAISIDFSRTLAWVNPDRYVCRNRIDRNTVRVRRIKYSAAASCITMSALMTHGTLLADLPAQRLARYAIAR
jgi:lipoate-protein ligase A